MSTATMAMILPKFAEKYLKIKITSATLGWKRMEVGSRRV